MDTPGKKKNYGCSCAVPSKTGNINVDFQNKISAFEKRKPLGIKEAVHVEKPFTEALFVYDVSLHLCFCFFVSLNIKPGLL